MDLSRAGWRTWAVILAVPALLAVVLLLAGRLSEPSEHSVARLLHWDRGMNTTLSPWLLGWIAVGSFTAGVLYVVQTLRQVALLP